MKKWICFVIVCVLMICVGGCSRSVDRLLERGEYEAALSVIEKNPEKYQDLFDEVRYKVALKKIDEEDFASAIELLQNNAYENASRLLTEAIYCRVAELLEEEECAQAIELLGNSKSKDAIALLRHAENLDSAIKIELFYNEMLMEMEEFNPDEWNPNFDYLEGADFYLRLCDMLNETYDLIVRDGSIENAKKMFVEIFGFEPYNTYQAMDDIENFKEALGYYSYYDSPACSYCALDYVMYDIFRHSDFVRFEMTDTSGFVIIENACAFLEENNFSAKTFAYLLGTCNTFGASIGRKAERIIVSYDNIKSGEYYSRGYFYCAPNSQSDEYLSFLNELEVSIDCWGFDENGVWMDVIFTNPQIRSIKYLSINAVLINVNGEHLKTASVLLKNVGGAEISFTLNFYDVTMDELIEKNCSVNFFCAPVFSSK